MKNLRLLGFSITVFRPDSELLYFSYQAENRLVELYEVIDSQMLAMNLFIQLRYMK